MFLRLLELLLQQLLLKLDVGLRVVIESTLALHVSLLLHLNRHQVDDAGVAAAVALLHTRLRDEGRGIGVQLGAVLLRSLLQALSLLLLFALL